eukprot:UN27564
MTDAKPKYELYYFGGPGRAEAARIMFTLAGVEFKDKFVEDWSKEKQTTPWGTVPVLSVDGKPLAQTRAILRFVGGVTNMYPKDSFLAAKCDEIINAMEDVGSAISKEGKGLEGDAKKKARADSCKSGNIKNLLTKVDTFIKDNGSDGHVIGKEMCIADVAVFCYANNLITGMWD